MARRYKFDKKFTEFVLKKYDYDLKLAAADIGCHYETLRRNAKKHGIELKHKYKRNKQPNRKSSSKLAKWLADNPVSLRSMSFPEIVKASGCSYKTVWSYMHYKRVKANKLIAAEPWFDSDKTVNLTTFEGINIPDTAFDKVKTFVHNRTGEIKLQVTLHTGQEYDFIYDVDDLARLYR